MIGSNRPVPRAPRTRTAQRGFALLIAIVLSSVAAAITLALTTLAYKALVLSTSAQQSEYAFYSADTALECALYWDSYHNLAFTYQGSAPQNVVCEQKTLSISATSVTVGGVQATEFQSGWFPVSGGPNCARITVYKLSDGHANLYGDGVGNATCVGDPSSPTITPRSTERGIKASY